MGTQPATDPEVDARQCSQRGLMRRQRQTLFPQCGTADTETKVPPCYMCVWGEGGGG